MKILEYMNEYKKVTEDIIVKLDIGEVCEALMERRDEILQEVSKEEGTTEELKKLVEDLKILELEGILREKIISEKNKVKEQMITLKKQKAAHNSYGNTLGDINFFSKKI